jgi:hypothetical protein
MTLNGPLHFSCRWPGVVILFRKPDIPFGGRELFWLCQRAVATDYEHETKGESEEKSGGNVRGLWLNCDRKKWTVRQVLKGDEHEWSFWEGPEAEKDWGKSFVQSRWSSRESLVRIFFSV